MINLSPKESTVILKYITYTECTLASHFQNDNNTHFWTDCNEIGIFQRSSRNEFNLFRKQSGIELRACDYYHTSRK